MTDTMNIVKRIYCRIYQLVLRILLPFLPYRNPEIVSSARDLPDIIKKNGSSHVLLVTDKGIRSIGLTRELEEALTESGVPYTIYDGTDPNPTTANVADVEALYKSEGCDAIIGFGGGSSMGWCQGSRRAHREAESDTRADGGHLKSTQKTAAFDRGPNNGGHRL